MKLEPSSNCNQWQVFGWALPPGEVVRALQLTERVRRGESGPFAGWVGHTYWYVYKLSGTGTQVAYYTYFYNHCRY